MVLTVLSMIPTTQEIELEPCLEVAHGVVATPANVVILNKLGPMVRLVDQVLAITRCLTFECSPAFEPTTFFVMELLT